MHEINAESHDRKLVKHKHESSESWDLFLLDEHFWSTTRLNLHHHIKQNSTF